MPRRTLEDIAKETGYAISTISGVLNKRADCFASEETRQKIHAAVERLGYRPNYFAHALRTRESKIIGVIGSLHASEIQSWQCAGLQAELRKKGYIVVLIDITLGVSKAFSEFDTMNADGVVVFYDRDDRKAIEKVAPHLPVLAVSSRPIQGICTIVIDRRAGVELMTNHLIKLGHRKIIFVTHKLSSNRMKHEGYVAAMTEAGLESEIRTIDSPKINLGSHLIVTENLEAFRGATAVVTTGDHVAVEVVSGLRRSGLEVPKHISVVGFGDDSSAVFSSPHITTTHVPRQDLGATAARMILNLMAGKTARNVHIIPEIVKRETDAPPAKRTRVEPRIVRNARRKVAVVG